MGKAIYVLVAGLVLMFVYGCKKDDAAKDAFKLEKYPPVAIAKQNGQKVFVHYMTWFETKETNGNNTWGMHWTMGNKNPDVTDQQGKREIASHFYPLIGPYASGDKDVVEYHLLLMKYAGIDGVMVDWYGTHDVYDYAKIRANTEAVAEMLGKVGLELSIVYEDRTTNAVVEQGKASSNVIAAKEDMLYLQSNFFAKPYYAKINGQPLLLVFGPGVLQTESEWTSVFSPINPKPWLLTLWNELQDAGRNAKGEYAWVYMDQTHLSDFYDSRVPNVNFSIGSAYPGFVDFYTEGGWPDDIHWTIPHNNGATLDETLQMSSDAGIDYLQLVTWNDFGEGTIIEPTSEFGFGYLDKIKAHTQVSGANGAFELIHRLYDLRKKHKAGATIQKQLDQVFYFLASLQTEKANELLASIENTD
ncbi:MAG: glycoside hydrolase family 71/99-like protein [Breznakibacter sp.]